MQASTLMIVSVMVMNGKWCDIHFSLTCMNFFLGGNCLRGVATTVKCVVDFNICQPSSELDYVKQWYDVGP